MLLIGCIVVAGVINSKLFSRITNLNPDSIETSLTSSNFCRRKTSFTIEPRFTRALSLLIERTSNSNPQNATLALRTYLGSIAPCLDIQYCSDPQMQSAEGYFTFSEETANRDRLLICVSESYKQEDDLLTATLIAHEATHAIQFVLDATGTTYGKIYQKTCYGKESMAFTEEVLFLKSLTQGELESVFARMFDASLANSKIGGIRSLVNIAIQSGERCREYKYNTENTTLCTIALITTNMEKMVRSSPFYQTECAQ